SATRRLFKAIVRYGSWNARTSSGRASAHGGTPCCFLHCAERESQRTEHFFQPAIGNLDHISLMGGLRISCLSPRILATARRLTAWRLGTRTRTVFAPAPVGAGSCRK